MSSGTLARLVWQNLRRNLKHNVLSAIGIVVGIAAFTGKEHEALGVASRADERSRAVEG